MGKASDWLREERRRTLGDWVAFCVDCGHAQRYFDDTEDGVPEFCPQCDGRIRARCPDCGARIASVFAVACDECRASLRPTSQYGTGIRRPGR
jgi:DNA-directed RNA polymerase subunit RPC12/RpoP